MPGMPGMNGGAHSVPLWNTLGAWAVFAWVILMWAAVAGLAFANRGTKRMSVYNASMAVIVLGVVAQIAHFAEHVAQAVYWIGHPEAPSWMTPIGSGLAKGFGRIDTSRPTLGMELLHLMGNFLFLAGLAAVMVITRRARNTQTRRWGTMGVWMQGIHGVEHLALTLSVWLGAKQAIGLSTWFGTLTPGPGATTYRVWWHALANLMGTCIFAMALWNLRRERGQICDSFRETPVTPPITPLAPVPALN
ncbi:MAG: hypothetical protein JF587_23185 [Catenulisporales bacterium]|nr:hypothetical protein [Catenulisporales bacterium]